MTQQSSRRLKSRLCRHSIPVETMEGLVGALESLMRVGMEDDPLFAERSLDLLVEHLKADRAYIVILENGIPETRWWSPEQEQDLPPDPILAFCAWLSQNPHRTLVLRDIEEGRFKENQYLARLGVKAAAGAPIWSGPMLKGFVFVHFNRPSQLSRIELAILDTVSGFLGRLLEVENMKLSLQSLENALEITKAVVEDSTIYDPVSQMPNKKYLDIWLSANLAMTSEDYPEMTIAALVVPMEKDEDRRRIHDLGKRVRGGYLMICEDHGRLLLVMQRTPRSQGHQFLQNLIEDFGGIPIGATVWIQGEDDIHFHSVRARLDVALSRSKAMNPHELVWSLPESF